MSSSYQEEWERKKEERRRRRVELSKNGDETNNNNNNIEINQIKLKSTPVKKANKEEIIPEAGQKFEELNETRSRKEEEKWLMSKKQFEEQEALYQERKEWREMKRKEQEEMERKLMEMKEEQRAKEAEERALREAELEAERTKQANERDTPEGIKITSFINAVKLAGVKSAEDRPQSAKSKRQIIAEKVPLLEITDDTTTDELRVLATELRKKLVIVMTQKFELEEKKKKQDYFLNELEQRISDMKKDSYMKPAPRLIIGTGIVNRMRDKGIESLQKDATFNPKPKLSDLPGKGTSSVSDRMNRLQAQLEADATRKPSPKKIELTKTYSSAEELVKGEGETAKEYEERKEARRKQVEKELAEVARINEEYRRKKEEERKEQEGEEERKRKMMEDTKKEKVETRGPLTQKEEHVMKEVPPLVINESADEEEVREIAVQLYERLIETFSDIFDLQLLKTDMDEEIQSLTQELEVVAPKPARKISTAFMSTEGKVKLRKEDTIKRSQAQNQRSNKIKEEIAFGSVRSRMAMFEGK